MNKESFIEYEVFGIKLPIILNILLVFLLVSTAFSFGVVSFLGVGLLPLINTVEIYLLFSFYASILALLIRMVFLFYTYLKELNDFGFKLIRGYLDKREIASNLENKIQINLIKIQKYGFYFLLIIAMWYLFYSAYFRLEFEYEIQEQLYDQVFDISLSAFVILLLGLVYYFFPTIRKILLILLLLQSLTFFFDAGKLWVSYHKNSETSVIIIYNDDVSEEGNIVFRSSTGILTYIKDNPNAQFINLSQVNRIEVKSGSEIDFRTNDFILLNSFKNWLNKD